jgi:hypothetical protein
MIDPVTGEIIDQKEPAERVLAQAKEQGVSLVGLGGLLNQLTRNVLETALEAQLIEHLGHEHGRTPSAANMRNGTRSKTVLTEIGPVEIEVPRNRDGSFGPVIVPKRKRRLDGIDQIVLSLSARGLTGESPRTSRRSTGPRSPKTPSAASQKRLLANSRSGRPDRWIRSIRCSSWTRS